MQIFKVTQGPLWCISYSLWNLWQWLLDIHTLWPSVTHCFYCARPTQKTNSCSVVKSLIKSLFVLSTLQQLKWVSVYPADTGKLCGPLILMYGCTYSVLGLAQDEICFPSGRCSGFWQSGLCCQITAEFGKWGDISWPAWAYEFFPPCHNVMWEGRRGWAMPMLDLGRRDRWGHKLEGECGSQLCSLALQSLASCTEELKNGDKLFRKG